MTRKKKEEEAVDAIEVESAPLDVAEEVVVEEPVVEEAPVEVPVEAPAEEPVVEPEVVEPQIDPESGLVVGSKAYNEYHNIG